MLKPRDSRSIHNLLLGSGDNVRLGNQAQIRLSPTPSQNLARLLAARLTRLTTASQGPAGGVSSWGGFSKTLVAVVVLGGKRLSWLRAEVVLL